ncbi:MAG: 3-hydroxybutyryl-CoA dehydrogenase, partial [Actinomycetia bacterium]|nr:3-hydroxybutyryl-CoA dehydrogenase [Actinomycetes bacterium]
MNEVQTVERVGVVGGGLMGSGIAEVAARAGADVIVIEANDRAAAASRERVVESLARAVRATKITDDELVATMEKMSFTTDMNELADRQMVIEAIIEDEAAKTATFKSIDSVLDGEQAILASNTSSIPIMKLAMATSRPENVIGIHFFNPVPVLQLVEIVTSLHTSESTVAQAEAFAHDQLGKRT